MLNYKTYRASKAFFSSQYKFSIVQGYLIFFIYVFQNKSIILVISMHL